MIHQAEKVLNTINTGKLTVLTVLNRQSAEKVE